MSARPASPEPRAPRGRRPASPASSDVEAASTQSRRQEAVSAAVAWFVNVLPARGEAEDDGGRFGAVAEVLIDRLPDEAIDRIRLASASDTPSAEELEAVRDLLGIEAFVLQARAGERGSESAARAL